MWSDPQTNILLTQSQEYCYIFQMEHCSQGKLDQVQQQKGRQTLNSTMRCQHTGTVSLKCRQGCMMRGNQCGDLLPLKADLTPLTADEFTIEGEALLVLVPFFQATVQLSEERWVSKSEAIPMMKMLNHALEHNTTTCTSEASSHRQWFHSGVDVCVD